MEGRSKLHERISDLLATLEINNNRLSLHEERISQLDIDVMRKQCIELYDQINRLALSGSLDRTVPTVESEFRSTPPQNTEDEAEAVRGEKEEQGQHAEQEKEEVRKREQPPLDEAPPKAAPKERATKQPSSQTEEPVSIHMKLQDEAEMVSLFEKYNSKPIDSIAKAINISKRFEFQNNFFDGDAPSYKKFIQQLDSAEDREAAFQVYHKYRDELQWENEDLKDELKSLLYRKFAT